MLSQYLIEILILCLLTPRSLINHFKHFFLLSSGNKETIYQNGNNGNCNPRPVTSFYNLNRSKNSNPQETACSQVVGFSINFYRKRRFLMDRQLNENSSKGNYKFDPYSVNHSPDHPMYDWSQAIGTPPSNPADSISGFTEALKIWSKNTFDNVFWKKRKFLNRLLGNRKALEFNPSPFLSSLEKEHQADLEGNYYDHFRDAKSAMSIGNKCVDWLAKSRASSSIAFVILECCPQQLSSILSEDVRGICLPRIVSSACNS
ncbi:hypothetical protein ACH5RR_021238 [Cinchona calisaya]|uniref:Uncharacterized protein n=1 Tax=Cinchona calisaya TaxID=153742 RepID=A0ABD2ZHQ9_9GENT